MRKSSCIFLLCVFLLNTFGYYGFLVALRGEVSEQMTEKIEGALQLRGGNVIFRIPLALPYSPEREGYHQARGEIAFDGQVYRLISKRYYRDTLYVVCIRDPKAEAVHEAINDYVKTFSDLPATTSAGLKLLGHFERDYVGAGFGLRTLQKGWTATMDPLYFSDNYELMFSSGIIHPPER